METAERMIRRSRRMTAHLMKSGFIKNPPKV